MALLGDVHTFVVDVRNSGTAGGTFTARIDAPFETSDARYAIAAGATVGVSVSITPDSIDERSGELELVLGTDVFVVPVAVTVSADRDGDGYVDQAAGGDDCDDDDPDRSPGAEERCNGLDDDCDDDVDEGLAIVEQWPDADEDGAGDADAAPIEDCELAVGFVGNDDDCDDDAPDTYLGAPEVWYDGLDQACDGGSDYDQDLDGVDRLPEGDDCDDTDATAYPGHEELADGVDNDCDGLRDEDTVVAGELVITEIFVDPQSTVARWVELHNPSTTTVDLDLVQLDADGDLSPLPSGFLEPGGLLLLCSEADNQRNGGLGCDEQVMLSTGARDLRLVTDDQLTVDRVDTTGWALTPGRSLELGIGLLDDAAANDDEASWCTAVSLFGDDSGDRGTPGALQPPC